MDLLSSLECELKVMFPVLFAQFVEIKGLEKSYIWDFLLEVFLSFIPGGRNDESKHRMRGHLPKSL